MIDGYESTKAAGVRTDQRDLAELELKNATIRSY